MPRVNAAWDLDGQGNNVIRGGYGLFYNRNMGNVEYSAFSVAARLLPHRHRRLGGNGSGAASGWPMTRSTKSAFGCSTCPR